jgi:predicted esterase
VILLHGRGDSADGILGLAREIDMPDVAYVAPQAARHTWYPYSFLAPFERNEPALGSALRVLSEQVAILGEQGFGPERVVLMGFSQGACLSLEFAARHARRYAGVVALSGGLMGPAGTPRPYAGGFDETPLFLGCSDVDPHIPLDRVRESADVCRRLGADVDERIYPGMAHTVNDDEIRAVRALLAPTAAGDGS